MTLKQPGYFARPMPDAGSLETPSTSDASEKRDELLYRLVSIDPVRTPADCVGADWHIYRIAQGENGITGYRRGDVEAVRAAVATIVAALNERRQAKKDKEPSKHHRRAPPAPPPAAAK